MTQMIPIGLEKSMAMQLIISQGWSFAPPNGGQVAVEKCPFCLKDGGKFYIAVEGDPTSSSRDGLWFCHKCQATGNLRTLQEKLGLRVANVHSNKEWAEKKDTPDALPNVELCHARLLGDADAVDYLLNVRGFSQEIIERQKLGLIEKHYFRKAGETRALVIPYLSNEGNITFAKLRTLPPAEKDFTSPHGYEATLYNSPALNDECKEITMVEGECDALSLMSHGIESVVGVPGAGVRKHSWIEAIDRINPKVYILFDSDRAGTKGAQELASRVGLDRCLKINLPTGVKDINEYFVQGGTTEGFEELKQKAVQFDVSGVSSAANTLDEIEGELEGKSELSPTYTSPWPALNKVVSFESGDVIDIVAPGKVGKANGINSLAKTPTGWVAFKDIKVGTELASVDGKPNFVTGVFPQGKLPMFEVSFSDDRKTLVSAEHLWRVSCDTPWERNNNSRVYTTDTILGEYCYPGSRRRSKLYVPLVSGDFGSDSELPIDPWLLGVLIGDGGLTHGQPRISSADLEIVNRSTLALQKTEDALVPDGGKYGYRINGGRTKAALSKLSLWGHKAESKFIPKLYLEASKEQRWELLRGLMDTDGTAGNRQGTPSYCTVSKKLAEDFVYLVRSLGGLAKVGTPQKKHFRYKGEMRTGQPAYVIIVRVPDTSKVFSLQRKLAKVKPRQKQPRLTFKSITSAGVYEAVCISVSHPSKLYVTDDFIVTHNTTLGLNLIDHLTDVYGENGLVICLEMERKRLAKKWISMVTGYEESLAVPGSEEAKRNLVEFKAAIGKARNIQNMRTADLYFAYPQQIKAPEDIYKLMTDCIRRYDIKFIMFDNLQLLCDTIIGSRQGQRTVLLSQISKGLTRIAKDYGKVLIRIVQPKQLEKGAVIESRDVDGSSQIEKDCDCQLLMWRKVIGTKTQSAYDEELKEKEESSETFDSLTKITVALSRYSSGGKCWLTFDGAKSQVRSQDTTEKPQTQQQFNSLLPMEKPDTAVKLPTEGIAI